MVTTYRNSRLQITETCVRNLEKLAVTTYTNLRSQLIEIYSHNLETRCFAALSSYYFVGLCLLDV